MWNNLPYDVRENTNVCVPREEARRDMVLPSGPCQLQHLLHFLLPTESFCSGVREGCGGDMGKRWVLYLLPAAEWSIKKLPTPLTPLHPSAAKG